MELYLRQVPRATDPIKARDTLYHSYCPWGDHFPNIDGYCSSIYEAIGDILRLQNVQIIDDIVVSGIEIHQFGGANDYAHISVLSNLNWAIDGNCHRTLSI